ncbi:Ig-like domain-containing protein [Rhizobium sp. BK251]|uniref:Ig-like domain-containing protein n=1 Tax=Rhizobium sp. BK251 TaxID=2512125 RepID=UPI001047DEA8|nr:Ig-like domain-containing protein [Rhizobium sp. BK251]TCL70203.1 LysM domain-containing protein [Rhizobium sp. BK251]
MMKNRAGLLALLVLAAATILMVFFVLPRIGQEAKPVGDAINQAGAELKDTVAEGAKTARNAAEDATATAEKVGRLSSDAGTALTELKALFADGKGPTADVFAGAKAKAEASLKSIADLAAPEGADEATNALVTTARDRASKALAIIHSLPENIVDALAAIAKAEASLTGAPEPQVDGQAQNTPQQNGSTIPSFDVLRVEPDGSTVIAGSAEAGAKLEVLDGQNVITTTNVGATGDFAAVLDTPLPAGDHQLVLKATGKDGKSTVSEEVATISVPKDGSGTELLAMVSKPGEASRIITAPQAKPASDGSQVASANAPVAGSADTAIAGSTTAPQPSAPAVETSSASPANSTTSQPEAPASGIAPAAAAPDIMVNAVEIERNKIFVAGATKPNAKVRAYADDQLIGEAKAGSDGHFVVDGVMALAVGDHKIRVDVIDDSGKTLMRASVNFNRPAGDQVTVAAQSPGVAKGNDGTMVSLDQGQLDKLRDDASKAFGILQGLFANGNVPGVEELAAARSATEFALKALSEFRPAVDAGEELKQASTAASTNAAAALTALQALPKDAKGLNAALGKLNDMIGSIGVSAAAPTPTDDEVASAGDVEPKTIEQAPLTATNSTVIIRRGDTLWQISRRIYGQGVRYTTIYMANEDKILNPDRILPGQTFGVPKDALPNAEELHRKRLSGKHL